MGQFLLPLVLWLANRKESAFADYHGKQVLNFQISMLIYSSLVGLGTIPFALGSLPGFRNWTGSSSPFSLFTEFHIQMDSPFQNFPEFWLPLGIGGILVLGIYVTNIVYTILGIVKSANGEYFRYPLSIKFIK
jgi:uncharacterized Tic20 family protein